MSNVQILKISEFCKTGSGGTPSRKKSEYYDDGTIPWVKSGELRENIITGTEEKITFEAINRSSAKIVPKGALLLAMYGATVGRLAQLGIDAATNQAVCNIQPDEKIAYPKYLYYALLTKVPEFLKSAAGGAQPNISQGLIRDTLIPLPPLKEQKRIAAILDKADGLRRKREKAIALTDDLLRSVFLDMFGDPVTNPKGWEVVPLNLIANIKSGITKGRKLNGQELFDTSYMRVANVQDGYLKLNDVASIPATKVEIEKFRLFKNDILLTEGGDPDKLGRGAVWKGEIEHCIHQNHIFSVRILPGSKFKSYFLSTLIGSQYGKQYFLRAAKQTTGIATINKSQLSEFPVLAPPLKLQDKFESYILYCENFRFRLSGILDDHSQLMQALSQNAFRGEL